MTTNNSLIKLDAIKKVFYTDEVDTHALAGIHLEIKKGEYIYRRPVRVRQIDVALDSRPARFADRRQLHPQCAAGGEPRPLPARAHSQSRSRFHLSELQS